MMMGAGFLFMVLIGLVIIGVPLLIIALVTGGGLAGLFKSQPPRETGPNPSPLSHESANERKCSTCGRTVQPNWNTCPSCGVTLT